MLLPAVAASTAASLRLLCLRLCQLQPLSLLHLKATGGTRSCGCGCHCCAVTALIALAAAHAVMLFLAPPEGYRQHQHSSFGQAAPITSSSLLHYATAAGPLIFSIRCRCCCCCCWTALLRPLRPQQLQRMLPMLPHPPPPTPKTCPPPTHTHTPEGYRGHEHSSLGQGPHHLLQLAPLRNCFGTPDLFQHFVKVIITDLHAHRRARSTAHSTACLLSENT